MSDILIKNMKMPVNCLHCGFSHMASDCLKIWIICKPKDISVTDGDAVKEGRPDWCPLIEVHTPHGRLIDADALDICRREQQAWQDYEHNPDNEYLEGVKDGLHEAEKCLSTAPTIIPAEPCKEKGE